MMLPGPLLSCGLGSVLPHPWVSSSLLTSMERPGKLAALWDGLALPGLGRGCNQAVNHHQETLQKDESFYSNIACSVPSLHCPLHSSRTVCQEPLFLDRASTLAA